MTGDIDLFGIRVPPAVAYRKDGRLRKNGYAARPGTGPKGQRCYSCQHCQRVQHDGIRSHKCELIAARWTYEADTDIKHNAPACSDWQRKQYPKAA
jgi:hypothetical protein